MLFEYAEEYRGMTKNTRVQHYILIAGEYYFQPTLHKVEA